MLKGESKLNKQNFKDRNRQYSKYITNHQIRYPQVLCINQNGENLGVIPIEKALAIAQESELDLMMVSGDSSRTPTCRILDFSKFKYEQEKKEKLLKKKQRETAIKIKEVKIRPATGDNDLLNKARQMQEFIDDGNKVKITLMFKGRELCHKNIGIETLVKFVEMIKNAQLDGDPVMSGKNMVAMIKRNESVFSGNTVVVNQ
jgi:translation initiation factor IF-3